MMERLLSFLLILSVAVLGVMLLMKTNEDFHIRYKQKSYSYSASQTSDQFDITLFASDDESMYIDETHISNASIVNQETTEKVGVMIDDITVGDAITIEGKTYYEVTLNCTLSASASWFEIAYSDATLDIVYNNKDDLKIPLGEFYYLFSNDPGKLRVQELIATHEEYHDLTVSGVYISLSHIVGTKIEIIDITLGTNIAKVNHQYSKELDESIQYTEKLEDILGVRTYEYKGSQTGQISYHLGINDTLSIYLPLLYQSDSLAIHQFYIKIGYMVDGEYHIDVIDDFPYIRQNITEIKAEEYQIYVPSNYSQ